MIFQLTQYCDMECPHCMGSYNEDGEHATMDTVSQICKFTQLYRPTSLLISGGEPTDHPNFLELFEYILYNTDAMIILTSNGKFLYNKTIKDKLIELNNKFLFSIQISAIKGLYKRVKSTNTLFTSIKRKLKLGYISNELAVVDQLGRAKGKDWSKYSTYVRQVPNCFNLLSCGYSNDCTTFKDVITAIHTKNNCKPFITEKGNIHISESPVCRHIGTIWDDDKTLYNNLYNTEPCGNCGVPYEQAIRRLKLVYEHKRN